MSTKNSDRDHLGYTFWCNVDRKRGDTSLAEISRTSGLRYQLVKTQRSDNTLPRADHAFIIAKALNTTCEYLLTGKEPEDNPFREYLPFIEQCPPDRLESVRILLGMSIEKKSAAGSSGTKVG
jgi:hypothetical protein